MQIPREHQPQGLPVSSEQSRGLSHFTFQAGGQQTSLEPRATELLSSGAGSGGPEGWPFSRLLPKVQGRFLPHPWVPDPVPTAPPSLATPSPTEHDGWPVSHIICLAPKTEAKQSSATQVS